MRIILNSRTDCSSFDAALRELASGASRVSAAVSYVQTGGWQLFRTCAGQLEPTSVRLVCTDQMAITQPAAISRAISEGAQVRNFGGDVTYHPKVFLAHNAQGVATRFLVGSANLSTSAFTTSVEAGVLGDDAAGLRVLHDWFNDLFQNRSEPITPERLRTMEENWRQAALNRTRRRFQMRRGLIVPANTPAPVEPADLEVVDDVFATIQLPIGLLNMDYAGNNIRNVGRVREVLREWATVRFSARPARVKQRSELKLLGFTDGSTLTELGTAALAAASDEAVAELWCGWLQRTPNAELAAINPKLLVAKRVFPQFWRLQPEVRDHFLRNAVDPVDRRLSQTIELLCNARDLVQELTLEDIRTLVPLLDQPNQIPAHIRADVAEYFDNKGTRSWRYEDRRMLPEAWRDAAGPTA
jgi:HKD family nuclease